MGILGELNQMAVSGRIDEMHKLMHEDCANQHTKTSDLHTNPSHTANAVNKQVHHKDAASFAPIH